MATSIEIFRNHIIEAGVLDPVGIHHEFVSGLHGRKLDFDLIPDGDPLLDEWADVAAEAIDRLYPVTGYERLVVLSVANGTNRMVEPIADRLGKRATALLTRKISPKAVELTPDSAEQLGSLNPDMVVAFEDVGTKGTTSASAVVSARTAGARRVEAMNTWQRREQLEELIAVNALYTSIIYEPLPSLDPEVCRSTGYCSETPPWAFIEHAK